MIKNKNREQFGYLSAMFSIFCMITVITSNNVLRHVASDRERYIKFFLYRFDAFICYDLREYVTYDETVGFAFFQHTHTLVKGRMSTL